MVMIGNPTIQALRQGMKEAGLTQQQLFEGYRFRQGKVKQPNTVGAWVRGERDAPHLQLMILFGVVNDTLKAQGKEPVTVPFTLGLVGDDRHIDSPAVSSKRSPSPGRLTPLVEPVAA